MPITRIDPPSLFLSPNYCHVAITSAGRIAHVSGQIATNGEGTLVGKGDLRAQAIQVYENLKLALAAVGADFDAVAKIVTYIVDIAPEKVAVMREVRGRYFSAGAKPASTMLGVTGLALPDLLVEVEAIALLPS